MVTDTKAWFTISNVEELDSPSLVIYEDRLDQNLDWMIQTAGGSQRLIPHMKTHKMAEVLKKLLKRGITKIKCATLAEAELAAREGMNEIVVAHALVGPKKKRFFQLVEKFPDVAWSTLVDHLDELNAWKREIEHTRRTVSLYVDVNVGMNRSGHVVNEELKRLVELLLAEPGIQFMGFHVYDGHVRSTEFKDRQHQIESGIAPFYAFLEANSWSHHRIIAGGSPAFTVHALAPDRLCSPGTGVFWDSGYGNALPEQGFRPAALVLARVISKPAPGIVTLDAGHKSMSSENPISQRMTWLNAPTDYTWKSQSEEHGVLEVEDDRLYHIGDVLYGLPYHICPTVNLYDEAYVIRANRAEEIWQIEGRKRKLTV